MLKVNKEIELNWTINVSEMGVMNRVTLHALIENAVF